MLYSRIFNLTYLKCFNSILAGFTFMFLHNFLASLKKKKIPSNTIQLKYFCFHMHCTRNFIKTPNQGK